MSYPGGKEGSGVWQRLISLMPPHKGYIELFLGGGAVMRHKRLAPEFNIGADVDPDVVGKFPRDEGVKLVCLPWEAVFEVERVYFYRADVLVYLDPPYVLASRNYRKYYKFELSVPDHVALLAAVRRWRCMVMLSGYSTGMYEEALKGWRRVEYSARTRGGVPRQEVVWMNFKEPEELHDYRFLGADFRERECIRRQQVRWRAKLEKMGVQRRYALLGVLAGQDIGGSRGAVLNGKKGDGAQKEIGNAE